LIGRKVPNEDDEPFQKGETMGLSRYKVRASIAVSDIARATEFYEGKLGLSAAEIQSDESRIYTCGEDSSLHVYISPAHAGNATATLATWYVADLEEVVDELRSSGVTFEHYDDPTLRADEKGIHELGDGRVAWFKDPDGNTFAIEQ
jgi:catechol 2,3-dioxygenase-like lactoylglutathione lyase family enzyme